MFSLAFIEPDDAPTSKEEPMRYVIPAIALLSIVFVAPSPASAQTGGKSLQDAFNACVEIAKQRGWSSQDMGENRPAARKFVIRCMQGSQKQARR
jgi:hypothetical protein